MKTGPGPAPDRLGGVTGTSRADQIPLSWKWAGPEKTRPRHTDHPIETRHRLTLEIEASENRTLSRPTDRIGGVSNRARAEQIPRSCGPNRSRSGARLTLEVGAGDNRIPPHLPVARDGAARDGNCFTWNRAGSSSPRYRPEGRRGQKRGRFAGIPTRLGNRSGVSRNLARTWYP